MFAKYVQNFVEMLLEIWIFRNKEKLRYRGATCMQLWYVKDHMDNAFCM